MPLGAKPQVTHEGSILSSHNRVGPPTLFDGRAGGIYVVTTNIPEESLFFHAIS